MSFMKTEERSKKKFFMTEISKMSESVFFFWLLFIFYLLKRLTRLYK
jgi:hypothetical protein